MTSIKPSVNEQRTKHKGHGVGVGVLERKVQCASKHSDADDE